MENFVRYPLAETSCAQLYLHPELHHFSTLQSQLPIALPMVDGYWALPLRDNKHQVIGHLALTFSKERFPDILTLAALQQLIAHRASAELERLRSEAPAEAPARATPAPAAPATPAKKPAAKKPPAKKPAAKKA